MTSSLALPPPAPVLVVEDDSANRVVLAKVVEKAGGVAVTAADAVQARAAIAAAPQPFSCALLDKNLPGEDGLSLMRHLRSAQPGCLAMIVTAYGNLDSAVEAIRLGAIDYVLKPFEVETLAQKVRLLLERSQLLSQQERLQSLLLQNDRLASLGTLATSVVHEFSNALTFVTSTLDLLDNALPRLAGPDRAASSPELAELGALLADVRFGVHQMVVLARDVKTFSRADDAPPMADPRPAIEAALRMAWPHLRSRAALVVDYRPVPAVSLAEGRLAQVLLNLVLNAVQSLPERRPGDEVRVSLRAGAAGEAVLEVSDTGSGIAPEVLPYVFEPHFTTKPVGIGSGLGLSVCRSIAEAAGGGVQVESAPGQGALFRVALPGATRVQANPGRPRVLVAVADPALSASVRRILWADADVLSVSSHDRALARVAQGEPFQSLVCELGPGGAAPKLLEEVSRVAPALAQEALLVASSSRTRPTPELLAARPGRCLLKPFDEAGLRAFLQRAVRPRT